MSMSDEKFELTISDLAVSGTYYADIADELRARDTTQREALARVEAERDEALEFMRINARSGMSYAEQRDTAQAQLAEMRRVVAGFLFNYDDGVGKPWERRLLDYARKLVPPKEFDAQAEQPKAQGAQAKEFQREDRYIVIKHKDLEALHRDAFGPTQVAIEAFYAGLRMIEVKLPRRDYLVIEGDWPEYEPTWAAIQARVAGKGAQAGEFWTWLDLAYRDGSKGEGRNFTKHNMEVAYRAGTEAARAALATQPAEWIDPCPLTGVGKYYDQGFADGVAEAKRLNAVRGAEHE